MADRIDELLGKTLLPFTFLVFIPEWLEPPTRIIVLQNDASLEKGPITKWKIDKLKESMKKKDSCDLDSILN